MDTSYSYKGKSRPNPSMNISSVRSVDFVPEVSDGQT